MWSAISGQWSVTGITRWCLLTVIICLSLTKWKVITQRWLNVGPTSKTLSQHWGNAGPICFKISSSRRWRGWQRYEIRSSLVRSNMATHLSIYVCIYLILTDKPAPSVLYSMVTPRRERSKAVYLKPPPPPPNNGTWSVDLCSTDIHEKMQKWLNKKCQIFIYRQQIMRVKVA